MTGVVAFNGDLSKWDVSSAMTMHAMFHNAAEFNGMFDRDMGT